MNTVLLLPIQHFLSINAYSLNMCAPLHSVYIIYGQTPQNYISTVIYMLMTSKYLSPKQSLLLRFFLTCPPGYSQIQTNKKNKLILFKPKSVLPLLFHLSENEIYLVIKVRNI